MAQVSFIQAVGFETTGLGSTAVTKLRYVDFEFTKSVANPDFDKTLEQLQQEGRVGIEVTAIPSTIDVASKFLENKVTFKVPFLTMLTIPTLRIEEITIDFNAKLNSTETSNVSSEFAASAELGINYKVVNFKATASYKRTSTSGISVEKTYNLGVHVKAVSDELAPGLERILTMLEDSIASING